MSEDALVVVVEIPSGSRNKYEYDAELDAIVLDRRLFTSMAYPADYGFIKGTLAEDGDPLDALVLVGDPTFPGCHIRVRPVGVFHMTDEKGPDEKVICVPLKDPAFLRVHDVHDIAPEFRQEIEHFFQVYKDLEHKKTETHGYGNRVDAERVISEAQVRAGYALTDDHHRAGRVLGDPVGRRAEQVVAQEVPAMTEHDQVVPACVAYAEITSAACPGRSSTSISTPACSALLSGAARRARRRSGPSPVSPRRPRRSWPRRPGAVLRPRVRSGCAPVTLGELDRLGEGATERLGSVDRDEDPLERHLCQLALERRAGVGGIGAVRRLGLPRLRGGWKKRCAIAVGTIAESTTTAIRSENCVRSMMPAFSP